MRTGIIGLPQVGKTSLFTIVTKTHVASTHGNPREAHLGTATVPDDRLDRLSAVYNPKKLVHATVEYADLAAIGKESLKESAYAASLRQVDAIAHVLRAFEDPSIPHVGPVDPSRDVKNVEFDLIIDDLGVAERRLERLQKEMKTKKTADLERENEVLLRAKAHLETERALREMELTSDERKRVRGFMFLSLKPVLYVLNVGESADLGRALVEAPARFGLSDVEKRPASGVTAVCGKVEAELAEMSDADAAEFLASYALTESGLVRFIRKTYELLGLISFFTVGEDECRAWTVPRGSRAVEAAGAIHSDLEKHFIRAETIRWDELLAAGSEAAARAKGTLRLEGKDYVVSDGDVLHIRHSG
jgi:GTP-binding protein YchF